MTAGRRERLVYMIGNAHIDPVWLWQWQEGLHEVRATFRSALDRMDEYPEFIFTCDSVAYLEWVEAVDPELFKDIARRIAEGRFVVVGGWWIEPDCNLPHGESFVRQALYAQRFLADRFGAVATVGCNVDPFGHAATLPQLLAKAGIGSYMFLRPRRRKRPCPQKRSGGLRPTVRACSRTASLTTTRVVGRAIWRRSSGTPWNGCRPTKNNLWSSMAWATTVAVRRGPTSTVSAALMPPTTACAWSRRALAATSTPWPAAPTCPRTWEISSTMRWAATRLTRGSSAGTVAPSTCCWPPSAGAAWPPISGARPTPRPSWPRPGSPYCSTSSTTFWRERPSRRPTTTPGTSTAMPAAWRPTPSTSPSSR